VTRETSRQKTQGTQRRSPEAAQAYLELLVGYFAGLLAAGRGDSARARSLHALYFFEYIWSNTQLPLYSYRPSRRPAAFLAMVFDLMGDVSGAYTQRLLGGDEAQVRRELASRLAAPWPSLLAQLRSSDLRCLAAILDETLRAALRQPAQSDLPAYLAKLRFYMTSAQLARVSVPSLLESLTVAEVFDYLRFAPPPRERAGEEQHPASGDLRKAIRSSYDRLWAAALTDLEPGIVTLLATLPVDVLALLKTADSKNAELKNEAGDEDFAVFYARLTDANAPGRSWRPPPHLVAPEEWADFAFLAARGARNSLSRRAQGLSRLGLSSTFPETVGRLDAWLEQGVAFPELHAHRPWREAVLEQADLIVQTRARFLDVLARRLGVDHDEL
jgi:hypothetical protein